MQGVPKTLISAFKPETSVKDMYYKLKCYVIKVKQICEIDKNF